jgi:hypothetical protein
VRVAGAVSAFINTINLEYSNWVGGGDFGGRVSVISGTRAGAYHHVTRVEVGRVVDTMRSRRSSLPEDYQLSGTAITP